MKVSLCVGFLAFDTFTFAHHSSFTGCLNLRINSILMQQIAFLSEKTPQLSCAMLIFYCAQVPVQVFLVLPVLQGSVTFEKV